MDATELRNEKGELTHIFLCGTCRRVAQDRDVAERCCRCSFCGKPVEKAPGAAYYRNHEECDAKSRAETLKRQIEKAEKLETWDGWVHNSGPGGGPNDDYAASVEDLAEYLEEKVANGDMDPADWPEYVFVCVERPMRRIDSDDILEMLGDDMDEGFADRVNGLVALDVALKAFGEANAGLVSYEPDYKRVVKVPAYTPEAKE